MRSAATVLVLFVVGIVTFSAQAPTAFEVASVKRNTAGFGGLNRLSPRPGGSFVFSNATLPLLIQSAHAVRADQLVGGPSWIRSDRFDIVAKVPDTLPADARPQDLLRTLLADRFKLVVHRETREGPIYTLTLAHADGRLGPQLHRSQTDCAAIAAAPARPGTPGATPASGPGNPRPCTMATLMGAQKMSISASAMTPAGLTSVLSTRVGRPVVDGTGLTGRFDFQLQFTLDMQTVPGPDDSALSVFTALQEQLGLKLQPGRGPVEVLVIDSVEQPTPD